METVELGQDRYPVVPQPHTYLKRRLNRLFGSLQDMNLEAGNLADVASQKGYEILEVFIPGLMPRWKFEGFPTEAAFDAGEELDISGDPATSTAPTVPQIMDAISAGLRVNAIDRFKALGNVFSPELLRAIVRQQMLQVVLPTTAEIPSSSSPSPSGDSPSTSGSATPPTAEWSEVQPSPASVISSTDMSSAGDGSSASSPSL